MGKTSQPLTILCVGIWGPEFEALREQGHTVEQSSEERQNILDDYDIICGPTCWRLRPRLLKYLPLALKEARAAKSKRKVKT